MKIKHKKIYALASLFTLVFLTSAPTIKDTHAALTPPTSYDLSYEYVGISGKFFFRDVNFNSQTQLDFERTSSSGYFNYTNYNQYNVNGYDETGGYLGMTMTFNRSNTSWTQTSGSFYHPSFAETKIGSDSTVGTIISKVYLKFNNQTNKDYGLFLDMSSSPTAAIPLNVFIDGYRVYDDSSVSLSWNTPWISFLSLYIPSYSYLEIEVRTTSTSRYLDAWYLQDLGLSAAYNVGLTDNSAAYELGFDAGYDAADAPNLLISAAESIIGIFVNFMFIIFTLDIFGVSILTIVGVLFGILAITWILKTLRG